MTDRPPPLTEAYASACSSRHIAVLAETNDAIRVVARHVGLDLDDQVQRDAAMGVLTLISDYSQLGYPLKSIQGYLLSAVAAAEIDHQVVAGGQDLG